MTYNWPMKFRQTICFTLLLTFGCGGQAALGPDHTPSEPTGVVQTLIDLLDQQDKIQIKGEDYPNSSLNPPSQSISPYYNGLVSLSTPVGYRIKLRYLRFGFALVEALRITRDDELKRRLIEMAQWSRKPEVRAEAITTLASLSDPAHVKYLKSAALDSNVNIRFAAIMGLQIWQQPEALKILQMVRWRDWSPFMQILAAQALLSLGDETGLETLWKGLDDHSWVVRSMAA